MSQALQYQKFQFERLGNHVAGAMHFFNRVTVFKDF